MVSWLVVNPLHFNIVEAERILDTNEVLTLDGLGFGLEGIFPFYKDAQIFVIEDLKWKITGCFSDYAESSSCRPIEIYQDQKNIKSLVIFHVEDIVSMLDWLICKYQSFGKL